MSLKGFMASLLSWPTTLLRQRSGQLSRAQANDRQGWRKASWPLSYHLIILALVTILPLLVLAGLSLRNSFHAEWGTAYQNAQRIADGVMARFDRELLGAITLLNVLARDTAFDRREYRLLYDRAKEGALDRKGNILLVAPDERVIFSTGAEFGAELPRATAAQGPAAKMVQPYVTDLFTGNLTKKPKFAVIVPIVRRGQAVGRLHLTIEPDELSAAVTDPGLPPDWQFALVDRTGKTVASSAAITRIGERIPQPFLAGAPDDAGLFEVPDDHHSLLAAFRRSKVTGWLGYALIPHSAIEMPFARIWREFLATGISFLTISMIAAYLLSRTMTRPIDGLTRAATALGRGEQFLMPHSSLREANLLGEAIGQAAVELRHRTEALSESERRFRLFADQTTDMIWFLDIAKDRIDYMSPAFEKIWGRSKSDVCDMEDWRRMVHPDDLAILDAEIAKPGQGSVQAEYRIVRPDGTVRWVRDTRFPLEEAGKPPRIIAGIVRDFTERREAIENLTGARAEAENRLAELEHLYESSPIGLAVVGRDYRLQRINDFIANINGSSHDECLGRPLFEVLPEIKAVAEPLLRRILEGGGAVRGAEFQTDRPGGGKAISWAAHFYPIAGNGHGVSGIGIILEDITEQQVHQRALARLAAIVYAANDAMFSINLSGMIMNWNPAAEAIFHYTPDEAAGKRFSMLFPEGQAEECEALLREAGWGESARLDTELRRKDATPIPVSLSIAPIRGGNETIAVSVTIEDITDRKRFEERQLLMNRELAHRVKNSLAVIQAMARHTLRTASSPQAFATAFEGRLQAMSTSHNLLTVSQWEGAELSELIREQLAPSIVGADRLRLSGPSLKLPPGIATSLGLVLHELSTNAVKYGALSVPAGRIDISWTVEGTGRDRRLRLDWRESGGPTVTPPREKGFGSTLIENSGKVTQRFEADGLRCSVEMIFSEDAPRAY
jgi:PAS domain S-box-containing protein